jgi:hypothetical protein
MYIQTRHHCSLKEAIFKAFPQLPLPSLHWLAQTQLEGALQSFLREKRWPELVGVRLNLPGFVLGIWALQELEKVGFSVGVGHVQRHINEGRPAAV